MQLGDCYAQGLGVERGRIQAIQWYSKLGFYNDDAQYEIAVLLAEPDWSQSNPKQALTIFRSLELGGYPLAAFQLGMLNAKGIALPQNHKKAIEKWRRVSRYGSFGIESALGEKGVALYKKKTKNLYVNHVSARAEKILYELAVEAVYLIGELVLDGKGTKKDPELAAGCLKLAADEGHAKAALSLSQMYRDGKAVEVLGSESLDYLKLAAENGSDLAMYEVGRLYFEEGQAICDEAVALDYLKKAGEQGHHRARKLYNAHGDTSHEFKETEPVDIPEKGDGLIDDIRVGSRCFGKYSGMAV